MRVTSAMRDGSAARAQQEDWCLRAVTLDGDPAVIRGAGHPFALVSRMDGKGGDVEYSWAAVSRILQHNGGAFVS